MLSLTRKPKSISRTHCQRLPDTNVSAAGAKLLNSKFCVIYVLTEDEENRWHSKEQKQPAHPVHVSLSLGIWVSAYPRDTRTIDRLVAAAATNMCSLEQEETFGRRSFGLSVWG